MKIVELPLSSLKRPEKNVRIHSEGQIKEFCKSVEMFGQIRPIVVDENNTILAGNGLYETLMKIGAKTADCYIVSGMSAQKKKKLMLADNRIYSLGEDDLASIEEIINELDGDLDIPGFDCDLISMFLSESEGPGSNTSHDENRSSSDAWPQITDGCVKKKEYISVKEHDVDESKANTICETGQLWALGEHRLLCGDSTKAETISRLMQNDLARMIFTDPPWNVNLGARTNVRWIHRTIINDNLSDSEYTASAMSLATSGTAGRRRPGQKGILGASPWRAR